MEVTGLCNICGMEKESVAHALFRCNHARILWEVMSQCWSLPSPAAFYIQSPTWFQEVLLQASDHMIDNIMLVAWRVWYARNEVTHGKSLPPIEGSKNFLCSYLRTLHNIKDLPVEVMIKGKQIMVEAGKAPQTRVKLSVQDKPWSRPPTGWVKLSI
jgi:hypothetical protein